MLTLNAHTASSGNFFTLFRRVCALLALLALLPAASAAQNDQDAPVLEPGKPIERELAGDAAHSYRITLAANQFLHVVVEQKGIDVVVALFAPDGKKVAEVDSPNGTQGPEPISVLAEAAGSYRLGVRSLEVKAKAGHYEVKIVERRAATTRDRQALLAEQSLAEGLRLQEEKKPEALRQAIEQYTAALPLWRGLGDRAKEAKTLLMIARAYRSVNEEQKALEFYGQVLPIWREVGDRVNEADTLFSMAASYKALGEMQRALKALTEVLPIRRATKDVFGEAAALLALGGTYDSLEEQTKALDYFKQVLPLLPVVGNRQLEANTLTGIGGIYLKLGELQTALKYYDQALLIYRAIGHGSGQAMTLTGMGATYNILGRHQEALLFLLEALPLQRAAGNRKGEAATLNTIGTVYSSLGETQKALEFLKQSLKLRQDIGVRSEEVTTLVNIASIYRRLGDRKEALRFYNQALDVSREAGKRESEAHALINLGEFYITQGESQKALDALRQALPLTRATGNRRLEIYALNNTGVILNSLGRRQEAKDLLNHALSNAREVGDRDGEAGNLFNLSDIESDSGNLLGALRPIEEALEIIDSLRGNINDQNLRTSYFASKQKYYELYIDLLMRLHKQKPSEGHDGRALQASERRRARSLLEILTEANADIRQGVDSKLLERERALQQQLNAKAQQQIRLLSGRHNKEQAGAIAKEIDALTNEFQQIAAQIRQTSPRYAALTQPQPLSAQEIQAQVLDADTLLLEYALGGKKSYLWAVTPTSIMSYELPKRAEIEDAARQFYALLTARPQGATSGAPEKREVGSAMRQQAGEKSAEVAASLSRMLLGPVAGQLGRKRLLIVADGALQYVPFGALHAPSTGDAKMGKAQPLVVRHEIVNLPSASTLAVLRRGARERQPAPKALAVLADPVFESTDGRIKKRDAQTASKSNGASLNADEERGLGLVLAKTAKESGVTSEESGVAGDTLRIPRLLGTRREAEQIIKLVPAAERKQALDFAASRQTVTDPELSQYRYVHFATHGFLNSQHPELSGLMFTMFDEEGRAQDGFLRAHEVFNLKLAAEVVVLSACQTGLGKEVRGEGLVGLTRGFMYAGAPRVVVSLWNVSDAATAELMTRFYRGMLVEKLRPAKALQKAQVSMLNDRRYSHPFYWAAFTLQGEWR
ncbi:MAG: CHAT domain-containing protein [Pyrinomonadaceae bacterium]